MQEATTLPDEPRSLAILETAERMLAEIATLDEAQQLIGLAEQARVYARQSTLGTSAINHATVIKVRAERRLADIVDQGQARGEIATPGDSATLRDRNIATYADLGMDSRKVSEARVLRDGYTDAELEGIRGEADQKDRTLSRTSLLHDARKVAKSKASPVVKLRDRKGKTTKPTGAREVFICPQCGHRDERSAFRKEILKWRK